jgi:hypothetical protein
MHCEEHEAPVSWSAATCDFRGAGVYVGLAPEYEHMAVARGLGAKQIQIYVGGRIRAQGEARPWALHYYAIRDPSAVRVIPVHQPKLPNGFKPVQLRFRFPPNNGRHAVVVCPPADSRSGTVAAAAPVGFIVSVGLAAERELAFFHETVERHLDQDWEQVFRRVAELGCRGTAA